MAYAGAVFFTSDAFSASEIERLNKSEIGNSHEHAHLGHTDWEITQKSLLEDNREIPFKHSIRDLEK